jgi:hypothetical protein
MMKKMMTKRGHLLYIRKCFFAYFISEKKEAIVENTEYSI